MKTNFSCLQNKFFGKSIKKVQKELSFLLYTNNLKYDKIYIIRSKKWTQEQS